MLKFEGKCNGRRLCVCVEAEQATVELLSGHQSGSVFHFALTELKKQPDIIIDSATRLRSVCLIIALLAGLMGVMSALHWGEGITKQAVSICAPLLIAAILVMVTSPKRKVLVWSTKTGVQAFAFEETKQNRNALGEFMASLGSLIVKA